MASTISVNFATVEEVFRTIENPLDKDKPFSDAPPKKSVSARVLAEALGGGVVGGGYVQRTGGTASSMTGFLYLTGKMPVEPNHAVSKKYVDDHSYTRRYHFVCRNGGTPGDRPPGYLSVGSSVVSGYDLNTNPFYFFDKTDVSRQAIYQYVDVYRDGILQRFGADDDYEIINTVTFFGGVTAIKFKEPFEEGTTVQVNIGNVGALPLLFGVATLSSGYGLMTTTFSGDVSLFVTPSSFAASSLEVSLSSERNKFVSPNTLSAHPLVPRGMGLFRREDPEFPKDPPEDRFSNINGEYVRLRSFKVTRVKNDPDREVGVPPDNRKFRAYIEPGHLQTNLYNAVVSVNLQEFNTDDLSYAYVMSDTRTLTSFDFYVVDAIGNVPAVIYEISIMIY